MNKWIVGAGILIVALLGLFFFFNMNGNVLTGCLVAGPSIESESFRISDFGFSDSDELNGGVDNGEDES